MKLIKIDYQLNKNELLALLTNEAYYENKHDLLTAFKNREEEFSTGLVNGVAIPHALVNASESEIIVVQLNKPIIDFETLDESNVDLVIGLVVPKDSQDHLQMLTKLSSKLASNETLDKIKKSQSSDEIQAILQLDI